MTPCFHELAIAVGVQLGVGQLRLVLRQVGLGLRQGHLIGPRIDDRQQIALFARPGLP